MVFAFDVRSPNSSFIDLIWHTRSAHAGAFMSEAASNWEMVFTNFGSTKLVTVRGPETQASQAAYLGDVEFFGITFRLGTFMPHLPIRTLLNRRDAMLPRASRQSFWLKGEVWELPTFENADVFINRLIRREILVRDSVVEAAIQGQAHDLSLRSLQHRFLHTTGLAHKTIQQIERARNAVSLLEQGAPILDTALDLGYYDQAHLTNALKRFIGRTPTQIAPDR
jgi:AraC-like DNA-binding protein